jgi:KUP system potassium uptake protein
MLMTTCLAFAVVWRRWQWGLLAAIAWAAPALVIDLTFLAANALKIGTGGWLPLVVAAAVFTLILVWAKGRRRLTTLTREGSVPLAELAQSLRQSPPQRVSGTAIFLAAVPKLSPRALTNNLKHNKVLHERNVILTISVTDSPYVDPGRRIAREPVDENFERITLSYGFMEQADLPRDLGFGRKGAAFEALATSFFLSRPMIVASGAGMPPWQDTLFGFLLRNANDRSDFLCIPPNRIVELGVQVEL